MRFYNYFVQFYMISVALYMFLLIFSCFGGDWGCLWGVPGGCLGGVWEVLGRGWLPKMEGFEFNNERICHVFLIYLLKTLILFGANRLGRLSRLFEIIDIFGARPIRGGLLTGA